MSFIQKLAEISRKNRSLLCVGLDPDPAAMPDGVDILTFNKAIIDATKDLVCAYKPNIAFYEAQGNEGLDILRATRNYIPADIPVIIDAKRGDIGNTAKAYAKSLFDDFNFDAVTASPFLGHDSLEPFISYEDRGVIILCRTSNPGAGDFQSLTCRTDDGDKMLYEIVAEKVNEWNTADPDYAHIPVIVITAFAETMQREKTISMGASSYLVKPLSAHKLSNSISAVLEKGAG